jgi:hypothetical protein
MQPRSYLGILFYQHQPHTQHTSPYRYMHF